MSKVVWGLLYDNVLAPLEGAKGTLAAAEALAAESRRLGGNPAAAADHASLLKDVKSRLKKVEPTAAVVKKLSALVAAALAAA